MSMYCDQCQETVKNEACTVKGVCGKEETTAGLQDLLVGALQGLAVCLENQGSAGDEQTGDLMLETLFATITNANFDDEKLAEFMRSVLRARNELRQGMEVREQELPEAATWEETTIEEFRSKAKEVGIISLDKDEDKRSLKATILYGLKGVAAYAHHAAILGKTDKNVQTFMVKGLAALTKELPTEELIALVLETGEAAVNAMAALDEAHTSHYGNPEISEVNIGTRNNPGILISGHDLKDMEELLEQTQGTGVDVYTHCEMLPANYYPAFKKYEHFVGNYGNSWWKQNEEFRSFNGPIIMTTNCITPVQDAYKERLFTTGVAGYPGVKHIPDREKGGQKDFSDVIELAKTCPPPQQIETGHIVGGFAQAQVVQVAEKVVAAVKSGKIKRFVVMAGCDGRFASRQYFTDIAQSLPEDAVILTAGCAKYRYNKLPLGDIDGIPRVLDAGQCNDSYSLAVIALKLKDIFGVEDVNELPIEFDIAWYEQKAVCVLLALLYLGFKGIRLGPTLPAFLSENVAGVLVEKFDIRPIGDVHEDVAAIMGTAA